MIELNNVDFQYPNGTIALKNINLRIKKGECVAIMGPNGAGKTTLIRLFNGLLRPTNGSVFFEGKNVRELSIGAISKRVGIIFQNPLNQLFSNTVEDEIKFSLKNMDLSNEEFAEKKIKTLKRYDFEKYKSRSPLNLSGGEAKKLAIASITCREPDVLVFDEPTIGQDAKQIELFIELLKGEKEKKTTIILVTHNVEFAFQFIPRVILMSAGEILADGPSSKVLTNEYLISSASLVYPELHRFKLGLRAIGLPISDKVITKNDLIEFLTEYINNIKR